MKKQSQVWIVESNYGSVMHVCATEEIAKAWKEIDYDCDRIYDYELEFYVPQPDVVMTVTFVNFEVGRKEFRQALAYEEVMFRWAAYNRDGSGTVHFRGKDDDDVNAQLDERLARIPRIKELFAENEKLSKIEDSGSNIISGYYEMVVPTHVHTIVQFAKEED